MTAPQSRHKIPQTFIKLVHGLIRIFLGRKHGINRYIVTIRLLQKIITELQVVTFTPKLKIFIIGYVFVSRVNSPSGSKTFNLSNVKRL